MGGIVEVPDRPSCLTIREQAVPDHWVRYNTMSMLGSVLTGQDKFEQAETLLLESYQGLEDNPATPGIRKQEAIERIIELYNAWEKQEQAAEWQNKISVLQQSDTTKES